MSFHLERNAHGRLVLTDADGVAHVGVVPVRAFPIAAPRRGLSLVGAEGASWPGSTARTTLRAGAARAARRGTGGARVHAGDPAAAPVSTFSTPSTWAVDTDRGATRFVLKGEEDIRRLGRTCC